MKIGVIGAGIAGGYLVSALGQLGHEVVVFEKSRGFGGRLATRRGEGVQFDHGAPCFTARTALFKAFLAEHASSVGMGATSNDAQSAGNPQTRLV